MRTARVDLRHRLEKLRKAYTGSLEEVILADLVATALDSGATRIRLEPQTAGSRLTVIDDGRGMTRRQMTGLPRAEPDTPTRAGSIGSAGVGLRLALLLCDEVVIEARRTTGPVAGRWLPHRHRAQWSWIAPPGLLREPGTAVRLQLSNPMSPLLDAGYLDEAIRTHFAALFDPACDSLLRRHYRRGVAISVGDRRIGFQPRTGDRVALPVTFGRKRTPVAIVTMERHANPVPEDQQGMAVSTRGRVIARGWHLLGLTPALAWRVTGLVEAPELASDLRATKTDFVRSSAGGSKYPAYRKAVQAIVARQLSEWGEPTNPESDPRAARTEKELERILGSLAPHFPGLRALADDPDDGQHPLPLPDKGEPALALFAPDEGAALAAPSRDGDGDGAPAVPQGGADRRMRLVRFGLLVRFESRPDDTQPGRLSDRTIWINDAHPACVRAASSRASSYHHAVAIALVLAPHAAPGSDRVFVSRFLAEWGAMTQADKPMRRS